MKFLLASCLYSAYAVFIYRIAWRILTLSRQTPQGDNNGVSRRQTTLSLAKSIGDILLMSRLFRANTRLWIGEWIFHLSFFLVVLRHLRYVLDPVPEWISALQPAGICSGYVLPFSLLYILALKIAIEKKRYISSYNFFLLGTLLFMSTTGLIMRTLLRPDIVQIKVFMIGLFSFAPGAAPGGSMFAAHFIMAFILLVCLPTHIFAAPFSVFSAREREDRLKLLMHGK